MKKWVLAGLLSLLCISFVQAQDDAEGKKGFDKSKLFFGGNFGLSFGDYTLINISPQVGYRFNKTLAAGMGFNMQYISVKDRPNGIIYSKTSQGVAGLNIFGRVYPAQFLLLQAQPEANYVWGKVKYYNGSPSDVLDARIVPSLLLGGGVAMPAGRGAFLATVFYDVLQNTYSPYGRQAIFNFGYNFGF
ncbi:MAG: hypothetical protein JSU05_04770 [Bacteroidetes bacterium]|nr:hypothetical protein [Bacteroidota bacterium]